MVTVFDVLLGVVPCSTCVAQVVGHQLTSENNAGQECSECCITDTETNDDRCEYCEQCWGGELTQRRCGADVDDWAVVRLLCAGHDAAVSKLAAHFLYNNTSCATNCANCECREHERN